jgi:hypothetical protein
MIGICVLFLCLGGCKSIPPETNVHTVSETSEKIDNDLVDLNDKQSDRNISVHSFTDSEESSVSQTRITHYDISLPKDALTGVYLVKSIVETVIVRGLKVNSDRDEAEQIAVRELSQRTDKSKAI